MALRAVFFDVGETLIDETGMCERAADASGVPRFTLMGVLGGLAARGERHSKAWSGRWGVEKPAPGFFERLVTEAGVAAGEIAYVGDRVDNDVTPARAAGMLAVHIRRGPWGYLQGAATADVRIGSLDELPEAFADV